MIEAIVVITVLLTAAYYWRLARAHHRVVQEAGHYHVRLPELQDGGILIKDENDEWRCVMPEYFDKETTRQERLFLTWVFILSGILFAIAAGLWWFS